MAKYRQGRINEEVARELSGIIRGVKDPRVSGAIISVTSVDCTNDLKYAKVYYSAISEDNSETEKGLKSASGYIRSQLAERLNLRATPELKFYLDNSIEHGANISALLKSVAGDLTKTSDEDNDTSGDISGDISEEDDES